MSCNWFPTKVDCFHEFFAYTILIICFKYKCMYWHRTVHQGNRYPAARNSASPPETFTQRLNTPGTVTILQGVNASRLIL